MKAPQDQERHSQTGGDAEENHHADQPEIRAIIDRVRLPQPQDERTHKRMARLAVPAAAKFASENDIEVLQGALRARNEHEIRITRRAPAG